MRQLLVRIESFSLEPNFLTRMHRNLRKRNGLSEAFCSFLWVLLYPWLLSNEIAYRVLYGQQAVLHLRNVQGTSDCRGTQPPLPSRSCDFQKATPEREQFPLTTNDPRLF